MDDGSPRALKAVLIDLSGTLHMEDPAVPGAQEALSSVYPTLTANHSPKPRLLQINQ
uniref:Uncharacterized protein n=1 Tax=Cyprinus carpio TaxID=7962 RepID=A0A8C1K6L4_CYPCA